MVCVAKAPCSMLKGMTLMWGRAAMRWPTEGARAVSGRGGVHAYVQPRGPITLQTPSTLCRLPSISAVLSTPASARTTSSMGCADAGADADSAQQIKELKARLSFLKRTHKYPLKERKLLITVPGLLKADLQRQGRLDLGADDWQKALGAEWAQLGLAERLAYRQRAHDNLDWHLQRQLDWQRRHPRVWAEMEELLRQVAELTGSRARTRPNRPRSGAAAAEAATDPDSDIDEAIYRLRLRIRSLANKMSHMKEKAGFPVHTRKHIPFSLYADEAMAERKRPGITVKQWHSLLKPEFQRLNDVERLRYQTRALENKCQQDQAEARWIEDNPETWSQIEEVSKEHKRLKDELRGLKRSSKPPS